MTTPTQKDLADSFLVAVLNGVVDLACVRRWADRLIEDSSVPEVWVIDLATSKTIAQVITALNACDGASTEGTPLGILMAAIRIKWRAGELHGMEVRTIVWRLTGVEFPSAVDHQRSVVEVLYEDAEAVSVQLGSCARTDRAFQRADDAIPALLDPFRSFEPFVPPEYDVVP